MRSRGSNPRGGSRRGWSATSAALVSGLVLSALGLAGWKAAAEVGRWRDFRAARLSLDAGDFTDARERLGRCLRAWPDDAEAHFLAARAARRAGDLAEATRELDAATKLRWVPEALDVERALLTVQRGDLRAVENVLENWLAAGHPEGDLILEVLAPAYYANFQLNEAAEATRRWVELRPNSATAWTLRGEVLERVRNKDLALEAYRHAAEVAPDDAAARVHLGKLLLDKHRTEEAAGHFEEAPRLPAKPGLKAEARLGLARCHAEAGRFDEAQALLDGLLADAPDDPAALRQRGRLELERERPAAAEPYLRKADARTPNDPDLLFDLSRCLGQQGKKEEADKTLARLKRCEEDLARLNELTQKLLQSPHDKELRVGMAEVLARNGQGRDGARWLEAVLHDDPGYAPAHRKLADYYAAAGDARLADIHRRLADAPPARSDGLNTPALRPARP